MRLIKDISSNGSKYYAETATQAEAEAGTSDGVIMTPLKTKYAIDALGDGLTNLDGGFPTSVYGGTTALDGGGA